MNDTKPLPAQDVGTGALLGLVRWALGDDTGSSSKHMAAVAAGFQGYGSHPVDPSDLGRCIRLVQTVPGVRDAFPAIAASTPKWAVIVEHWDELVALYEQECRGRRYFDALQTYRRMKELGL